VYPLAEFLLLLTCATIPWGDDFKDIVAWASITSIFSAVHIILLRYPGRALARTLGNRIPSSSDVVSKAG
jgi:hypothetical protein